MRLPRHRPPPVLRYGRWRRPDRRRGRWTGGPDQLGGKMGRCNRGA